MKLLESEADIVIFGEATRKDVDFICTTHREEYGNQLERRYEGDYINVYDITGGYQILSFNIVDCELTIY